LDLERDYQLQPLTLSLLLTPFITGVVAYMTNWLAIKMLFRPHRRRWYSFGWVGIIPRNRTKLANKVGFMVGEKLIDEGDIIKALNSEDVQNAISNAIEKELKKFLSTEHGTLGELLDKMGLNEDLVVKKLAELLNDEKTVGTLTSVFSSLSEPLMEKLADTELNTLVPKEGLDIVFKKVFTEGKWQNIIINELSNRMNNMVLSGKSLKDLLPEKINSSTGVAADFLTDKMLDTLEKFFEDPDSRKRISDKLIAIKDGMFSGGGFDQLKLGFVNMFLNEDSINDMVQEHLPKLITGIKNDVIVRKRISNGLQSKVDEFLAKPLYAHAGKIGFESIYEIRSDYVSRIQTYLSSEAFVTSASKAVESMLISGDSTIGSVAKTLGLDLKNKEIGKAVFSKVAESDTLKSALPHTIYKILKDIKISALYENIPEKSFSETKSNIIKWINSLIIKNVP
jgi:uncharacterized membrane protein YheB (UPF0754 family)